MGSVDPTSRQNAPPPWAQRLRLVIIVFLLLQVALFGLMLALRYSSSPKIYFDGRPAPNGACHEEPGDVIVCQQPSLAANANP
jgi:hypothetical protein